MSVCEWCEDYRQDLDLVKIEDTGETFWLCEKHRNGLRDTLGCLGKDTLVVVRLDTCRDVVLDGRDVLLKMGRTWGCGWIVTSSQDFEQDLKDAEEWARDYSVKRDDLITFRTKKRLFVVPRLALESHMVDVLDAQQWLS